jgi:hypothetical protein
MFTFVSENEKFSRCAHRSRRDGHRPARRGGDYISGYWQLTEKAEESLAALT